MNIILIVAKHMIGVAAPDCVGVDIPEGHNYIITGDFGYMGSTITRKEAFEVANVDAAANNAQVMIEE